MRFWRRERAIGVVDTRGSRIQGWAFDASANKPVSVDFYLDGRKVGSTIADRYRADLTAVSPHGRCAFDFTFPPEVMDGSLRSVEVRAEGARKPLTHGRFSAHLIPSAYHAGLARWMLRSGLWTLGGRREGDTIRLLGRCIDAPGSEPGRISANGRPLAISMSDASSEWKSPIPPGMAVRKFDTTLPLPRDRQHLHFSFGLDQPFRALHDFHYPLFDVPMPDPEQRRRVEGHDSEFDFDLGGYSTAIKLDILAERYAGRKLAAIGPVLDWGCGCGRVARFVAGSGAELSGADIDAESALWCGRHIAGNFTGLSLAPPTPFADNSFAAIYGISVFTHLTQHYEELWLAELQRIARPGALLLLSVHGGVAAANAGMLEHLFSPQFSAGFADLGRNPDIDAVTQGSGYYRNVFHQPGYIAKVWGRYFEIVAIEEGVIGNHQDLVVARRRA
jgi:SAM-dependent methyltransferase